MGIDRNRTFPWKANSYRIQLMPIQSLKRLDPADPRIGGDHSIV